MADIQILGDIVLDDFAVVYDWFGWSYTTPSKVASALAEAPKDEAVDVYINSPGGYVSAGQEIYSRLRNDSRVRCHVIGQACSAASMIAMGANYCDITPVGLLMVHCAAVHTEGNHRDLEKTAQVLKTIDRALAEAYAAKSGMSLERAIQMMEKETWLTANQCVELGLCDAIMPESEGVGLLDAVATVGSPKVTFAMLAEFTANRDKEEKRKNDLIREFESYSSRTGG